MVSLGAGTAVFVFYILSVLFVVISVLVFLGRQSRAQERIATALEAIARGPGGLPQAGDAPSDEAVT